MARIAKARFSYHLALEDVAGMQALARLVRESMSEVRVWGPWAQLGVRRA